MAVTLYNTAYLERHLHLQQATVHESIAHMNAYNKNYNVNVADVEEESQLNGSTVRPTNLTIV